MTRLLATVVFIMCVQTAHATNRGFMPGDAFFHSILTQDRCKQLADTETPSLPFVRPEDEQFAFCGYAGYWSLQLPSEFKPLIANLRTLYSDLRRQYPREVREQTDADGQTRQIETNGFHIFVYNHDFDPREYNIGLRYNESWVADESSFGPQPSITRLEPFVIDRVAFSNDWRDAESVPPLKTTCPPIPDQETRIQLGIGNKRIDAPVIAAGEIQIIVTTSPDFRRYIHRRNGATFYSVTNSGVKQFTAKKGKWVVTNWSPDTE